jgi:outer membrane protein
LAATFITLLAFIPQAASSFRYTPEQLNKLGLYFGGQIWQSEASSIFGEENTLIDFNLKKAQQKNYFVAVVHPLPLLPNARISSTSLDTTGKTTLTQEFSLGGETFSTGDDINTSFNVSYVDYTLYYQLLDYSKFSFDLGLTARDFNGAVSATGSTIIIDNNDDCPETPQSNICP